MTTSAPPTAQIRAGRGPTWAVLAISALAQFMVILDVSVVNVALPSMRESLDLSTSGLQWVVNAYTLAFAGLLLLGGRLSDFFGRKQIFLIGVTLFSAASLAGGFAQSDAWIVAARAAQGVGGAVLAPSTLSLLTTTYTEPHARARALSIWSAVAGAGGALGVVIGGVLTDVAGWRWVLFINVPVGVVLIAASVWALPPSRRAVRSLAGLDLPGSAAVTAGLTSVVYAVVGSQTHPWGSAHTLTPLLLGLALLAGFVVVESRTAAPLVPLRIFRRRSLTVADLVALLLGMGMFSFWFFLSLHLQRVMGYDALRAGLAFLPASLAMILGSTLAGRAVRRFGPRPILVVGPLLSAVGLLWLSGISASGSYAGQVFGPSLLAGFGLGLSLVPLTVAATAGVAHAEAGLASGLLNTSRQVGGALGLAVLSTVAASHTAGVLGISGAQAGAFGARIPASAIDAGYARALALAAGVVAAAGLVALALPRRASEPDTAAQDRQRSTSARSSDSSTLAASTSRSAAPSLQPSALTSSASRKRLRLPTVRS